MSINTAGIDPRTNREDEKMLLNPQMLNRYAYGLNNPYRYIDPNGKNPILIAAGLILLGELIWPQTLESPHKDSFIDRYSTDLLLMPLTTENIGGRFASKAIKRITNILKPGGRLIGEAGKSGAHIRIVKGGREEAERLFYKLAEGSNIIKHPKIEGGLIAELPEGGTIGYRPVSKTGSPTIDIHNVPGLPRIFKIKFE